MISKKVYPYTLREVPYSTLTKIHEFTYDDETALKYWEEKIKSNTGNMDYKTNVKGKMTDWNFFINDPEFKLFINDIFYPTIIKHNPLKGSNESLIQVKEAWGNVLNKGDSVQRHHHRNGYYSTIIYFDNVAPLQTDIGNIETFRGKVITIDGFLYHWVDPVPKDRVNLVFNWSILVDENNR